MKKVKWGRVIVALALVFYVSSCSSSSGGEPENDSNNGNETPVETPVEEVIPAVFVKVTGATVTGGTMFVSGNSDKDFYKGVFRDGRSVTIADFYMCDHEVTQAEYQAVMGNNPSFFKGESNAPATGETQANRPVETVSWYAAIVYCNKKSIADNLQPCYTINGKTNPSEWGDDIPDSNDDTWNAVTCDFTKNGYRLPTEAEWEYIAREGKTSGTTYSGSNTIDDIAWYGVNSGSKTHEVKSDKVSGTDSANALGIYDMTGNVWEWCWDWHGGISDYTAAAGPASGSYRVERGGSWFDNADGCSVSHQIFSDPFGRLSALGFRVVRNAQ